MHLNEPKVHPGFYAALDGDWFKEIQTSRSIFLPDSSRRISAATQLEQNFSHRSILLVLSVNHMTHRHTVDDPAATLMIVL